MPASATEIAPLISPTKSMKPGRIQDIDLVALVLARNHRRSQPKCGGESPPRPSRPTVVPSSTRPRRFVRARVEDHRLGQGRLTGAGVPDQRDVAKLRGSETCHYPSSAGPDLFAGCFGSVARTASVLPAAHRSDRKSTLPFYVQSGRLSKKTGLYCVLPDFRRNTPAGVRFRASIPQQDTF